MTAYHAALEECTRGAGAAAMGDDAEQSGQCAYRLWASGRAGTAHLEEAVTAYRAALEEYTPERVPLQWAMTQNNLGSALQTLGEREVGTARLEEAVTAYRAALEECTRERVPLDWARTQNNLGNALRTLGERGSETATPGRGGDGLSRGAGGTEARACAAGLGDNAEPIWAWRFRSWASGRPERRTWKRR